MRHTAHKAPVNAQNSPTSLAWYSLPVTTLARAGFFLFVCFFLFIALFFKMLVPYDVAESCFLALIPCFIFFYFA